MKHESAVEKASAPVIVQLLPDDRFFQGMAELHELVAQRAYELFAEGGFQHGHDLEAWLGAESQLLMPTPLEVSESPEAITVKIALSGWSAKDIEIHVEPQRVFISGQQLEKSEDKNGMNILSEQRLKRIFRSLDLPAQIDAKRVGATFSNGELQIELRKVKSDQKVADAMKAAA